MCRVDALGDTPNLEIGLEYRAKVDARLSQLEGVAALQVAEKAAPTNLAVVVAVTPKSCNADCAYQMQVRQSHHACHAR